MGRSAYSRHRIFTAVAAAAIAVWAIAGYLDARDRGYTDALFEPDYTIEHVPSGSPLDQAGFRRGDSVVSVEGIPAEELGMYSRWPRSLARRPGESLAMLVDRDGELVTGKLVYRDRPAGESMLAFGAGVVVLCFLGSGLWALYTVETQHAVRLGYIGLALAAAVPGPSLGSWNGVAGHLQTAAMVLWTILLLRFVLLFPTAKLVAENRLAKGAIYGGWGALLICMAAEVAFHPRLYHTFAPLYGLLILVYLGLAAASVIHTAVKTTRQGLTETGMGFILSGAVVAAGACVIALVDRAVLGTFDIPGSSYLPLLIGVVPFTMALAVRSQALSKQAESS